MMNELLTLFPDLKFVVSGVLGPYSNAHGPNEMLELSYTKKFISCMANMVKDVALKHMK